jgi:hypothetical protein
VRTTASLIAVALIVTAMVSPMAAQAQNAPAPESSGLRALIFRAAYNEERALESPAQFQFQERLEWSWGTETRTVIETQEGRTDRIVAFRDQPVTPEQQAKQQRRLEKLLSDKDAVRAELQDQRSELQRRINMIKAFPIAFIFDLVAREEGAILKFTFHPTPDFLPKDRETQMYRGMEGTVWIDVTQERIVRIEGKLVKDVSFGWGIFGKLYKGGTYEIAQTQISHGVWRITTLNVDVKGRIFVFGSFKFFRKESDSHLRATPASITYKRAVEILLAETPPGPAKPGDSTGPGATQSPSRQRKLLSPF